MPPSVDLSNLQISDSDESVAVGSLSQSFLGNMMKSNQYHRRNERGNHSFDGKNQLAPLNESFMLNGEADSDSQLYFSAKSYKQIGSGSHLPITDGLPVIDAGFEK